VGFRRNHEQIGLPLKEYSESHDGFLDGVFLDRSSAYIFLSTHRDELFVFEATQVDSLNIADFRKGNIIFEVLCHSANELSLEMIEAVNGGFPDVSRSRFAKKALELAVEKNLVLLEINPSYGATCLILASSLSLRSRQALVAGQFVEQDLKA
jgi:hypothetical protein